MKTPELAALGPFFAVEIHQRATAAVPPWQPFGTLLHDPGSRVRPVRGALALSAGRPVSDIELRVAASAAHLGLVARLLAPVIGASTVGADAMSLDVDEI